MNILMTTRKADISAQRYREIRDSAGMALIHYSDGELPVRPRMVLKNIGNCRLIPYSKYEREQLKEVDINAQDFFGTTDGCTVYCAKRHRYMVLYNDIAFIKNPWRARWTLAHEAGHIILKHPEETDEARFARGGIAEEKYKVLEMEADYFAAMLLAYPAVLRACNVRSSSALQNLCGLSSEAARCRYSSFASSKMTPSAIDSLVVNHFSSAIFAANSPFLPAEPDMSRFNF